MLLRLNRLFVLPWEGKLGAVLQICFSTRHMKSLLQFIGICVFRIFNSLFNVNHSLFQQP
jgi:hypothetical protein